MRPGLEPLNGALLVTVGGISRLQNLNVGSWSFRFRIQLAIEQPLSTLSSPMDTKGFRQRSPVYFP